MAVDAGMDADPEQSHFERRFDRAVMSANCTKRRKPRSRVRGFFAARLVRQGDKLAMMN
jgi:hypothetical protein